MSVQTVTFSPNSASETAIVSIPDDLLVEDAEGFLLSISQPSMGTISLASNISRGIIIDNDGN